MIMQESNVKASLLIPFCKWIALGECKDKKVKWFFILHFTVKKALKIKMITETVSEDCRKNVLGVANRE